MRMQQARTGMAVYRPPEKTTAESANFRPFGVTTKTTKPKIIKLPMRAQSELCILKRRLLAGYGARRFTPEFVRECFMEFPDLVSA